MRKITLLKLLEKHHNIRSTMIQHILDQHFKEISNDKPIAFVKVLQYLQKEGFLLSFDRKHLENLRDTELFQRYLTNQLESDKVLLDAKIEKATGTKSSFFVNTKPPRYWLDKFITQYDLLDHALNPKLQKFIKEMKLENTEKFYQTLCCLFHNPPFTLPPFPHMRKNDLRALSAEISLIKLLLKEDCYDAMVGAALSGSKKTLEFIMQYNKDHNIEFDTQMECDGKNILFYALKSGSLETIRYVVETLKIPVDAMSSCTAAWSGSVEALKYILPLPTKKSDYWTLELNPLMFAAMGGSKATMQYLFEILNFKPGTETEYGANILHFAAWSGSVEAIQYAIEKIAISPRSLDKDGKNLLHYAAISRSPEALRYILELNEKHHLNLSIDVEDENYDYDSWLNGCFTLSPQIKEMISQYNSKEHKHVV